MVHVVPQAALSEAAPFTPAAPAAQGGLGMNCWPQGSEDGFGGTRAMTGVRQEAGNEGFRRKA